MPRDGLGLAIARHILELHGDSIRAESAGEGYGATFKVQLPSSGDNASAPQRHSRRWDERPSMPQETLRLHGHTVLVVEDNEDARECRTDGSRSHSCRGRKQRARV
jgi:hypothetical protein